MIIILCLMNLFVSTGAAGKDNYVNSIKQVLVVSNGGLYSGKTKLEVVDEFVCRSL